MNSPRKTARLITIPISHYCERARWALDYVGFAYREEQHIQLFHWPHAWMAGRVKTVPVLVTDSGPLTDSADIVRFANEHAGEGRRLYPGDPAARDAILSLEARFQDPFGVDSRRLIYGYTFRWGRGALSYNGASAPKWEQQAVSLGFPVVRGFLRRYLRVNAEEEAAAKIRVLEVFDETAARLADGRPYLMGDEFTAADLTFACMAAAVVTPAEYGVLLPRPDQFPEDAARELQMFRAHPAGAFALKMFADHRRPARRHR